MKNLCPLPWLSLSTESQRELRLCCHETREKVSGCTLGDFQKVADAFNSPLFKEARKLMQRGQFPASCAGCLKLEEQTGHSPRLEYLDRFKEELPPLLSQTQEDGTLKEARLVYLDVTTDNHCNLKCRMCRPRYSEKILDDWNRMGWEPGPGEVSGIDINESISLYEKSPLLEESFSQLKMITLTGGEPFLSPAVSSLLNRVIKSGHAKDIELRFFTNTTVIPKELMLYLENFAHIHLFCSIDGHGKTSDYIRFPSRWKTIDRTYQELLDIKKKWTNLTLDLHTVVQALNITQLHELFHYLAQFKGEVPLLPSFTRVDSSLPLDPAYLSPENLKLANENFEDFVSENEELLKSTHQEFHQREIENYQAIISDSLENNKFDKFIDFVIYSKKLDKIRNQSLQETYPEFKL